MLRFNLAANLLCLVALLHRIICRSGDDRTPGILNPSQETSVNFPTAVSLHSAQRCVVLLIYDSSIIVFIPFNTVPLKTDPIQ